MNPQTTMVGVAVSREAEPARDAPDVSVIVTTCDRPGLVIDAVRSAIHQRAAPGAHVAPRTEVIVIDDSAEGTAQHAVASLGAGAALYVRRPRASGGLLGLVRNEAATLARAPYLLFLDDDDRLADGALALLHRAVTTTTAGMAFGRVVPFGGGPKLAADAAYFARAAGAARRSRHPISFAGQLLFDECPLVTSSCMVRRDAFFASGGYDDALSFCEDVDLFVRLGRARGAAFVDDDVVYYGVGFPSAIQAARKRLTGGSSRAIYRTMGQDYRDAHGALEFRALQAYVRAGRALRRLRANRPDSGELRRAAPRWWEGAAVGS